MSSRSRACHSRNCSCRTATRSQVRPARTTNTTEPSRHHSQLAHCPCMLSTQLLPPIQPVVTSHIHLPRTPQVGTKPRGCSTVHTAKLTYDRDDTNEGGPVAAAEQRQAHATMSFIMISFTISFYMFPERLSASEQRPAHTKSRTKRMGANAGWGSDTNT